MPCLSRLASGHSVTGDREANCRLGRAGEESGDVRTEQEELLQGTLGCALQLTKIP